MRRFLPLAALAALVITLLVPTAAGAGVPPPTGRSDLRAYHGLGTWVDGYDFSRELAGSSPSVTAAAVPAMKARGVTTIYLQAAREDSRVPTALMSKDRLGAILQAAHNNGIRVVAWYLPKFVDPSRDWWHLSAMLTFSWNGHRFDSIGLDIEDRTVTNVKTRNDRLVALSRLLRSKTRLPISAIVLPPVLTEIIRPTYWGGPFPWWSLKPSFDVWIPMGYYTAYSNWPQWRNAWNATMEDIRRIRYRVGNVPIHYAGGLAAPSTVTDYKGFLAGARYGKAIGASAYDYATTPSWAWYYLRAGSPR